MVPTCERCARVPPVQESLVGRAEAKKGGGKMILVADEIEARKFSYWCRFNKDGCKPGEECKYRRQQGMTWEKLAKLCPKKNKKKEG